MLNNLLLNSEAIVCAGSGGVGKTTVSAALGLMAAELGQKVIVLTVDPAKRLATTLGLTEKSSQETLVCKTTQGGELWANMIYPQDIFDQFIRESAPNIEAADRLIKNSLYQQLISRLQGSQEFTSLEKLYQLHSKNYYDLIILDTPPTQNAVDFLTAPQKILALFQDSITKWFLSSGDQSPGFLRTLIGMGTMRALKSLEFLTGARFIQELVDFFGSMRSFQRQLREHSESVQAVLKSSNTNFVLITGFDATKLSEAEQVTVDLKNMGFHLSSVIINRAQPEWLEHDGTVNAAPAPPEIVSFYNEVKDFYKNRLKVYKQFAREQNKNCEVYLLPEMEEEKLAGLEGLGSLSKSFQRQEG